MLNKSGNITYLIEYPHDLDETRKYPVLFFIHGAGGRGTDRSILSGYEVCRYRRNNPDKFPFLLVIPQCEHDSWFDIFEQLQAFVRHITGLPYADGKNVFLTGASMGGYTSYQLLMSMPDTFAGAVICCGGGMYWNAARIRTPVRIWHGKDDRTVFPDESIKMYDALKNCGKDVRLYLLENTGHDCWTAAFSDDGTYAFFRSLMTGGR